MLRVVNDDLNDGGTGYLYDPIKPGDISGDLYGKWEIIEDDEKGTLKRIIV